MYNSKTLQIFAVYDKTGTVHKGDPTHPREVVDYIVMERHLADSGSSWRLAGKVPPARMKQKRLKNTFVATS